MEMIPHPANDQPDAVIDRLCRQHTSDENVILVRDVKAEFTVWLEGHPDIVTRRAANVASAMVDSFVQRKRPKLGAGQLGLFRPEALVPIGHGKRAWMDDLTRDQFTLWRDIETKSFEQTRIVFDIKVGYWTERLDQWGAYATLGDLERHEYHWTDDQFTDDDDEDDDG